MRVNYLVTSIFWISAKEIKQLFLTGKGVQSRK